jgi:glucose-6-phosphate isomerase
MTTLPAALSLDLASGYLERSDRSERRVSDLRGYYRDVDAEARLIAAGDPLLYTVYEQATPEQNGQLRYGTTIIQPGRVGDEYFMTRGHYHARAEAGEVYLVLRGEGRLVLDRRDGPGEVVELHPGTVAYTPPGYAHRTVNVGDEPFVFLAVWPADAGHDYETIRDHGFGLRVVARDGSPTAVPGR